jgi:hypothetical protein
MKPVSLVIATPTPATGPLPTAMDISAPSARMMGLRSSFVHAMAVPDVESTRWMPAKNSRTLDTLTALAESATEESHFAHGRRGDFLPRTRGLAQHDV